MSGKRVSQAPSSGLSRKSRSRWPSWRWSESCAGSATTSRAPSVAVAPARPIDAAPPRKTVTPVELPPLHVVLDEPRFAAARERERVKDWTAAARAFDAARGTSGVGARAGVQVACALDFVSGRLHFAAGNTPRRRRRSNRAASAEACALAAHASLRASQAYARAGQADLAIVRGRSVPEDAVVSPDAQVVVAEALAARG